MPQPKNPNALDNITFYKLCTILETPNIEPNYVTLFNVIPSALTIYNLYNEQYIFFIIFFTIRSFLDCYDGHLARTYKKTSNFGATLDLLLDVSFFTGLLIVILKKNILLMILFFIILYIIIFNLLDNRNEELWNTLFFNESTILLPSYGLILYYVFNKL